MSTKEVAKTTSSNQRSFFDFPLSMSWLEDFVPRNAFFHNSNWQSIRIEEFMRDGKLVVRAEMPGFNPDKDIEISVGDGYLTIEAERSEEFKDDHRCEFTYGNFSRSIALPNGAKESSVHADYKDGILEISIEVPEKVNNHRKIPISKFRG